MRSAFPLMLLAAVAYAAPVPKDATKPGAKPDDAERIVGKWNGVSAFVGGRPQANPTAISYEFDADGNIGNGVAATNQRYTIDPMAKPKRMTWRQKVAGIEWRVVYALEGDSLTLGFIDPTDEIPNEIGPATVKVFHQLTRAVPSK